MPRRITIIGDGGARYLAFAKSQLKNFRRIVAVYAFKRRQQVAGGNTNITIGWTGDQEYIKIVTTGGDFFVWSVVDGIFRTRDLKIAWASIGQPTPSTATDIRGIFSTGDHKAAHLAHQPQPPLVNGVYPAKLFISLLFGVAATAVYTFNASFEFSGGKFRARNILEYSGKIRDGMGNVTGKRLNIIAKDVVTWRVYVVTETGTQLAAFVAPVPIPIGPSAGLFNPLLQIPRNISFHGKKTVLFYSEATGINTQSVRDQIYRSTDGGLTFTALAPGSSAIILYLESIQILPIGPHALETFTFFPLENDTIFAASNFGQRFFVSTDGGATFNINRTSVFPVPPGAPFVIITLAENSLFVVRGSSSPSIPATFFRSIDAGATWQSAAQPEPGILLHRLGLPRVTRAGTTPLTAEIAIPVYVGAAWFSYFSANSGTSWTKGGKIKVIPAPLSGTFGSDMQSINSLGAFSKPLAALPALPQLHENPL